MSQQNISILTLTLVASGTVVEHRAVGFDAVQANIQGQKVMGTAMTAAASGATYGVVTHGTAIIETGAAVTVGDSLIADSQGRAIPATGVLPEFVFADALQSASGTGEMIEVLLRR